MFEMSGFGTFLLCPNVAAAGRLDVWYRAVW